MVKPCIHELAVLSQVAAFIQRLYSYTINPQNYTAVNFRELAQYTDSKGKNFVVWWLKSKNAMPLILFVHVFFVNHGHS